jgi:hypothetical protein
MAEHWIKFEPKTFDKPRVLALRDKLSLDEFAIVGRLLKIWSWADTHSIDGKDIPLSRKNIDEMTKKRGFAKAMEEVGWLAGNDGCLTFPDFHKHNGSTAKGRAVTSNRVEKFRAGNASAVTTPPNGNANTVTTVTDEALPDREGEEDQIATDTDPHAGCAPASLPHALEWATKFSKGNAYALVIEPRWVMDWHAFREGAGWCISRSGGAEQPVRNWQSNLISWCQGEKKRMISAATRKPFSAGPNGKGFSTAAATAGLSQDQITGGKRDLSFLDKPHTPPTKP